MPLIYKSNDHTPQKYFAKVGTIVRLTHQQSADHRTPEYDARIEYDPGMTLVYTPVCTRSMTPKYVYSKDDSEDDTRMTPTTPR